MTTAVDVNSPKTLWSANVLGTIGVLSFIVEPGLVQGFVSKLGLSEAAANDLAFAEMIGIAIATYAIAAIGAKLSWRTTVGACLAIGAAMNVVSAFVIDPSLLKATRFVTGLAEGGVIAISWAIVSMTARPERNFALYLTLLLVYSALAFWGMPLALSTIGLKGIFLFWAALTAASLVTVNYLPHSMEERAHPSPTSVDLSLPFLIAALAGVLLFNIAVGVSWTNIFLIGMEISHDEQAVANALLVAQIAAVGGALGAVYVERRYGRWRPMGVGILGGAGFLVLLLLYPNYTVFFLSACGLAVLSNFVVPFILSEASDMSTTGEMMTRAVAMQMTGIAAGPFLAGRILNFAAGFTIVKVMAILLLVLSFLALIPPMLERRRIMAKSPA